MILILTVVELRGGGSAEAAAILIIDLDNYLGFWAGSPPEML